MREHLSGLPGGQPEPPLQLLVRAAARLAAALLHPGRAARLLPHVCGRPRPASPRPLRDRGAAARRSTTDAQLGRSRCATADGIEDPIEANAVISAVGQLNRPKLPDIAGRDALRRTVVPLGPLGPRRRPARQAGRGDRHRSERGPVHPGDRRARWPSCSCSSARRNWFAPDARLPRRGAAPASSGCTRTCPSTASGTASGSSGGPPTACCRTCGSTRSGSRRTSPSASSTTSLRQLLTAVPADASSPTGPICSTRSCPRTRSAAKRILRDNGIWATTLKRSNVHLVTEKITEITERSACVTGDGQEHEVDVRHLRHRVPGVEVPDADDGDRPRRRRSPRAVGRRGPRATSGITIPGFPNLFCLYGPNTNIVINGSIVYFSECEVRYILGCLDLLLETGHGALDVPARRARRVQRARRRRERAAWRGACRASTAGTRTTLGRVSAELAVHAARVLAAHQGAGPRRTTSSWAEQI